MPVKDVSSVIPDGSINTEDERKAFDTVDDKDDNKEKDDEEESTEDDKEKEDDSEEGEEDTESDDKSDEEDTENEDVDDEDKEESEELDESDSLYQQIKTAAPKLFKQIPELRKVIFREAAFTQVYPTVEEAKESVKNLEVFNAFQADALNGKSESLLESLETTDKKALERFVANFIPSVEKQNKELYFGMIYPEFKKMIRAAVATGNKAMVTSAENLHFFVFGNTDIKDDVGLKPSEKDEKEDKQTQREREFEERIYKTFHQDVSASTKGRALRIISRAFENSGMTEWQIKNLSNDIYNRVDSQIISDTRHQGQVNQIWRQAQKAGFTSEWKERISSAYLSRAKLLIPKVRQMVMSEAKIDASKLKTEEKKRPTRVASGSGNKTVNLSNKKVDGKKVDWTKTDERAMLDGEFVEKK